MRLLLICLLLSTFAAAQPGYTPISTSRYNWTLPSRFSGGLHIPAGGNPSLGTGQYVGAGAVYVDTTGADAGLYYYINGAWVAAGSGVDSLRRLPGSLNVQALKGGTWRTQFTDSIGGGGGDSDTTKQFWVLPRSFLTVPLSTATVTQQTAAVKNALGLAMATGRELVLDTMYTVRMDSLIVTAPVNIRGLGDHTGLRTLDTSGNLLKVDIPQVREYYNVIFPSHKPVTFRDFKLSYAGSDSTPNTNQRGLLITQTASVTFQHMIERVTFDHFWIGAENHNAHSCKYAFNLFNNNLKYDFLNTNDESQDFGKLDFMFNVLRTHDTVSGAFSARPSAAIKIEGGAGFSITGNDIYGYHNYGIWTQYKNTTEFFTSVGSTEHNYWDNTISFQLDYGIVIESDFGKTGSGSGTFNGNKIMDINIMNNRINNTKMILFDGGDNAFTNIKVSENVNTTVHSVVGAIIKRGTSMRFVTWQNNTINAVQVGGDGVVDGVTKPVIIEGGGYVIFQTKVTGNNYIGFPSPSDLLATDNLNSAVEEGDSTLHRVKFGRGTLSFPTYFPLKIGLAEGISDVSALGVAAEAGKTVYLLSNSATNIYGIGAYNFLGGGALPITIGVNGENVSMTGTLGVGTATPAYPFELVNAGFAQVGVTGGSAADIILKHTAASTNQKTWGFRSQSGKGEISSYTDAGSYQFQGIINWLNSNGNVGIGFGSFSPTHRLDVAGDLNVSADTYLATSSGSVGIGNTSPASLFSVGSSSQFQVNSSGKIAKYANTSITNGKILIGHTANGTFELGNIASANSSVTVTNNAGGIDLSVATPTESTYTPTLTNTSNVAASTAYAINYYQSGNTVWVWGDVSIDATAALTITEMGVSLPVASNFSSTLDLSGTATFEDNTTMQIKADATNDRAVFRGAPQTATNNRYSFTLIYKVIN